jgi:hypothetical protein
MFQKPRIKFALSVVPQVTEQVHNQLQSISVWLDIQIELFFFISFWGGVELSPLYWPIVPAPVDDG